MSPELAHLPGTELRLSHAAIRQPSPARGSNAHGSIIGGHDLNAKRSNAKRSIWDRVPGLSDADIKLTAPLAKQRQIRFVIVIAKERMHPPVATLSIQLVAVSNGVKSWSPFIVVSEETPSFFLPNVNFEGSAS